MKNKRLKRIAVIGGVLISLGIAGRFLINNYGKDWMLKRIIRQQPAAVSEKDVLLSWEGKTNVERGLPGVCISFDDWKVDNWFKYLRLLSDNYGAKFTLFVSSPDKLSDDELEKLKIMQEEGHEIGCHTWRHSSPTNAMNADDYMKREILPWFEFMEKKGFKKKDIRSFAHPHGQENGFLELKLVKEDYCQVLRLINQGNPSLVNYNWQKDPLVKNHHPIYAWGIDRKHNLEDREIIEALKKSQKEGLVLVLYAHDPSPPSPKDQYHYDYSVSQERLELIARTAKDLDLKFYLVRDLQRQPTRD